MMKIIKTKEIKEWCTEEMIGFTQRQLQDFIEAGANLQIFCVAHEESLKIFEIFIEVKTHDPETPKKRMVLVSARKERKFFTPQTACKLLFETLGIKSVVFWSAQKRKEEGLATDITPESQSKKRRKAK